MLPLTLTLTHFWSIAAMLRDIAVVMRADVERTHLQTMTMKNQMHSSPISVHA